MKRVFALLLISIFVLSSISAISAHDRVDPDDIGYFMTYGQFKFMYEDYYMDSRPYIPEYEIHSAYESWCRHHNFDPVW